jgi:hypothetical protein
MVVMTSLAAAVQGMDEAVINGAQIIYPRQFGLGDPTSRKQDHTRFFGLSVTTSLQSVTRGSLD